MKLMGLVFVSLMCFATASAANFSAFVQGDDLYITLMTDGCNAYNVALEVDGICKEGRLTANYATECSADLAVMSTEMYCGQIPPVAKVFKVSLTESKVAVEAQVLTLRYWGNTVDVQIKK